jgi:2-hydroxychromene-2-carboxylate isomerase
MSRTALSELNQPSREEAFTAALANGSCSRWTADPAAIASAAERAELDALHEQYTQDALIAGVFGAPSFVLPTGEIFWGQDRLELLERAL